MFDCNPTRVSIAFVVTAILFVAFVAGVFASGAYLLQAGQGGGFNRLAGFVAVLLGGWLAIVLVRRLISRTQQTIAELVSEGSASPATGRFFDSCYSSPKNRHEAQASELALLQMTLGPRVY